MNDPLFFMAILPGPEIREEVTAFKEHAARYFNASRALTSPPHITVFPPFKWETARYRELVRTMENFAAREKTFWIELKNFNAFAPRVIYVDVVENADLQSLEKRLVATLKDQLSLEKEHAQPFHPHMTVAFKDLDKAVFPKAWDYYSGLKYQRIFQAVALTLLHHENGKWHIDREIKWG
ncbi:MAG TPA: 2'-5' RNA ligase family protein [Flavilitoribacter sp.]|nr:2'-5' RNA ligase family protein [Flavilitoribacter sp.]